MEHACFFTQAEQELFGTLPESVREGWSVVPETVSVTEDDPKRQLVRLSLLRLHDPMFRSLQKQALACTSAKEMTALLASVDFSRLHEDDLLELVFVLGPASLSEIIAVKLKTVSSDEDLMGIAALSFLRHELQISTSRRS